MIIDTIADQVAAAIRNARLCEQARLEIADRKRIKEKMRESETKYRAMVEQSHDAIYIYKEDLFLFVNDRTCEFTGYSKEELLENDIWDLIHPEDKNKRHWRKKGQGRGSTLFFHCQGSEERRQGKNM